MGMVKRSDTHVIDTLAVRSIINQLPENWLVRGLEERDYGIDLSIELFDGEHPTGCYSLIQVKGTRSAFEDSVSFPKFPTKTLEYAQLFPEPFFLFHTSVSNGDTRFVWLQKYIEARLRSDRPKWADQNSNTIYFPDENTLSSVEGKRKIERIMRLLAAQRSGLDFLADFEWLKIHWENFQLGEVGVLASCVECVRRLATHKRFLTVYMHDFMEIDMAGLADKLQSLPVPLPTDGLGCSEEIAMDLDIIDLEVCKLDALKKHFLYHGEMDDFEAEYSSSSPY
jgi:hypothetical protein